MKLQNTKNYPTNLRMGGADCGYTMTDETLQFYEFMQILMQCQI